MTTTTTEAPPGIGQVMKAVSAACRDRGGVYAEYRCQIVSWDDAARGTVGGAVSQWGANATDSMLVARDGTLLFTVRPDNWNERLGRVSASQVAVLTGNHLPNELGAEYGTTSLEAYLKSAGTFGWYAGLPDSCNLYSDTLDHTVGIRFQTAFLPVENKSKANIEFCAQANNYNTLSDWNPKNLILLATTQGTAIQQDGAGAQRLFHHRVAVDGSVRRHWFEAERSGQGVGGEQLETEEEKRDALARGKAIARGIGIEAMKTRFNVLLTVQVPLESAPDARDHQNPVNETDTSSSEDFSSFVSTSEERYIKGAKTEVKEWKNQENKSPRTHKPKPLRSGSNSKAKKSSAKVSSIDQGPERNLEMSATQVGSTSSNLRQENEAYGTLFELDGALLEDNLSNTQPAPVSNNSPTGASVKNASTSTSETLKKGTANAARVSLGRQEDSTWGGLTVRNPKRHPSQQITVTAVIYNTVAGGDPSADDVIAAIDDMEALYKACAWAGHLTEDGAGFAKKEITLHDVATLATKLKDQP